MSDVIYDLGKIAIDGYYNYQQIRIAEQNEIRDIIRRKMENIPLDKPEEKKEKKDYLKKYTDEKLAVLLKELLHKKSITREEYDSMIKIIALSRETSTIEQHYKKTMHVYLMEETVWKDWLINIRGISDVLGSNLLKNIGYCENFQQISSLWRYCGLDPDGAKGRKKGEKIHYNPLMKTLAWKIGDSFIKQRTPTYRRIYDEEKARQLSLKEQGVENAPKSLLHADLRARRKMVKVFLQHYWLVCRDMKKLPVTMPYVFDRMGHNHYIPPPFYTMRTAIVKPVTD